MKVIRNVMVLLVLAALAGTPGVQYTAAQDKGKNAKAQDKGKDAKGKDAKGQPTFEMYKDSAGEFRFRFKDDDDTLLATSGKGYQTKSDCQRVIDTIRREAAKAKVEDQTK